MIPPDALLARKSNAHPAQPSYRGHVLMDNRHALIVDCKVTQATGTGERDAAKAMAAAIHGAHKKTLGTDKNYDTKGMVAELRRIGVTPHVAQNTSRPGGSAIDGRTTRHEGYAKSINGRRGIEKVFGWIEQWGGLRQFKLRGTGKVASLHVQSPPRSLINCLLTQENIRHNVAAHIKSAKCQRVVKATREKEPPKGLD